VLFVHGASNGGASWASLVARLVGFHCVLLDRPGCGLSDPIATRLDDIEGIEAYADTLIPDVLDAIGVDRAHVVSTSYGGYFALRAAAAHPDRIDRMVEFSWTIGATMAKVPMSMRFAGIPMLGELMARLPANERAVRMILRQVGLRRALETGRFDQVMIDWYVALLRDTRTMRNEIKSSPRLVRPLRGIDERVLLPPSLLAGINTPIYFLWGEEDPNGGADVARPFVGHIPNAELEMMPAAGHAPWIDDPEYAASTTRAFLSG
jgi:pimeloyl-ACP methyl ester carboxylesterase